jgi:hypothetical protein
MLPPLLARLLSRKTNGTALLHPAAQQLKGFFEHATLQQDQACGPCAPTSEVLGIDSMPKIAGDLFVYTLYCIMPTR